MADTQSFLCDFPTYEAWSAFEHRWPMRVGYEGDTVATVYMAKWLHDVFEPIYELLKAVSAGVEVVNQTISQCATEVINWFVSEFELLGVTVAVSLIGFATFLIKRQVSVEPFEYGSLEYGEGPYGVGPYGGGEVIKEL